ALPIFAAEGYPGTYRKGDAIDGLDAPQPHEVKVFHAGSRQSGDTVVTSGGRVLCVTALGEDIRVARERCYTAIDRISWDGMVLRQDIGWRALARYS
ncbi:MAG: phosphoribosylglycinamide synthetase C domain-containing protein, partial [Chromatocurvus sp.]